MPTSTVTVRVGVTDLWDLSETNHYKVIHLSYKILIMRRLKCPINNPSLKANPINVPHRRRPSPSFELFLSCQPENHETSCRLRGGDGFVISAPRGLASGS